MARGKIKAVLFIIVFVLAVAIGCNALIDLSENKAPEVTADPFLTTPSPDPGQSGSLPLETAAPTATPIPIVVTAMDFPILGGPINKQQTHANTKLHPLRTE